MLADNLWFRRGWTFQEYICSTRKLIFQDGTVSWECEASAWFEVDGKISLSNNSLGERNVGQFERRRRLDDSRWPNLYQLAWLVFIYNRRDLTYPEDALDAFTGVLSTIEHTFDGGFITGLPHTFFDSALYGKPGDI